MSGRLKVLVSAYACSPYQGSEPGVGWGFISELAKHHDLWVIVEDEKFRADIERYLAENPDFAQRIHFHFILKGRNRLLRKVWPPSYYWYYRRWHKDAFELAKKLHKEIGFDLAHQLTMVGFREPGYLWKLDIPFIWGPVGGMGLFPWRYLSVVGLYGALYYIGYNLYNWLQINFLDRPKLAAQRAASGATSGLIVATPENRDGAACYWGTESTVMTEVGLPRQPELKICERGDGEALQIVWTGLHISRKALNLALKSLARVSTDVIWELHILGKGRQTAAWQQLATDLGIAGRCHFHGWVAREKALEVMKSAHLMLITSLRDLTSTVTIEGLALGLPIVCLDHCGFAEVVDATCGVKVPLSWPEPTTKAIAQTIEVLGRDEEQRRVLAHGALARAQRYAWEEKARVVDEIYRAKLLPLNMVPGESS
jgi:glycosyltransferase involved in cell wall biosynthesis